MSEGVTASFRQLLPEVVFTGIITTTTGDAPLHARVPDSTAHSAGRYAQRACAIAFSVSFRVPTLLGLASWRPLRLLVRGESLACARGSGGLVVRNPMSHDVAGWKRPERVVRRAPKHDQGAISWKSRAVLCR